MGAGMSFMASTRSRAFDGGEGGGVGVDLAPVPPHQEGVFGVEGQVDPEVIGPGREFRRGLRRFDGEIRQQPEPPQPLALPGPEPEPPFFEFLEKAVEAASVVLLVQEVVGHLHGEVEDALSQDRLHLVIGVGLGGPPVFIEADAHAHVEEIVPGVALFLQLALHLADESAGQGGAIEPPPERVEEADVLAVFGLADKSIHKGLGRPPHLARQGDEAVGSVPVPGKQGFPGVAPVDGRFG